MENNVNDNEEQITTVNDDPPKERGYRNGFTREIYNYLVGKESTVTEVMSGVNAPNRNALVALMSYMHKKGMICKTADGKWTASVEVEWKRRGRYIGVNTLRQDVLNTLKGQPSMTLREIIKAMDGKNVQSVSTVISSLKKEGLVRSEGTQRSYRYVLVSEAEVAAA